MWFVTPNKAKERVGKSLTRFLFLVCSLGPRGAWKGPLGSQRAVVRVWRPGLLGKPCCGYRFAPLGFRHVLAWLRFILKRRTNMGEVVSRASQLERGRSETLRALSGVAFICTWEGFEYDSTFENRRFAFWLGHESAGAH
ncbi:hypothetical protein [uncultured Slackia sp.]|uniref:hypothetical protein n=1 Tax=uncultured Slackia sp. TaxID=665903 RepID=UPI0026DD1894|nr:hypothetical protein [uncultured Slackia sp.]